MHAFITALLGTALGTETYQEWLEWIDPYPRGSADAAAQTHPVQIMIAACKEYMQLIDDDWRQLADWYHMPSSASHQVRDI